MADSAVRLQGMRQLRREMRKMGGDLGQLKQANLESARIVERTAYGKAPVRTGKLRQTLRSSGTQTRGTVRAGFKRVPYAGPVHFGWASRPNPAKRWRGGPIPPNPFMYDALDERRGEVEKTYLKQVKRVQRKHGL